MGDKRDPVAARADDDSLDLYEISDWEVRTAFDRFVAWLYGAGISAIRWIVILGAILILVAQFALGGLGLIADPIVGAFVVLSAVPALLLAIYLWYADVTTQEPLEVLVATFLLGVLFASFASILNPVIGDIVRRVGSGFGLFPVFGALAFYFLVVGPVEEGVKMLAVRLHAYRHIRFDAVIDGAVYGAVAGLGFATIENALYITQTVESISQTTQLIGTGTGIATVRALAGPGHVIYSAFAGYYLGLAKFNPDRAGPIVLKGIIVASLVHGTYNTSVTFLTPAVAEIVEVPGILAFFGFVILYDSLFGYLLLRKLGKYKRAYRDVHSPAENGDHIPPEQTEFES